MPTDEEITPAELVDRYRAGATTLRDAVAGMDVVQLKARPIEGKMSTLEVVGHLVDSDERMGERMRRAIAGEEPFVAAGAPHHVEPPDQDLRNLAADLDAFEAFREELSSELSGLEPSAWERVAMRRGDTELTLHQLLQLTVRHVDNHVATIQEKRTVLGV